MHCPVLVVVGDLDLAHIQARGRELAARIAGATLAVMEGAAHLPGFEQPAAFAAAAARLPGRPPAIEPRAARAAPIRLAHRGANSPPVV